MATQSTLASLIGRRLCETDLLTEKLTQYAETPAIFFNAAPDDKMGGWNRKKQYPRITYYYDMQADAERKTSGQMIVNIWCEESGLYPEAIEPILKNCLCGVFLTPQDSGISYCLEWERSDAFDIPERDGKQPTQIIGIRMQFGIFAFPSQINTDPDPVLAINEYTKQIVPNCKIIAYDKLPEIYSPTLEEPAFYWRFGSMTNGKVSWAVAWIEGILTGHIFAPSTEDRLKLLKMLAQQAIIDEEATMLDNSPMFFKGVKADSAADFLRIGQMALRVRYGVLRKRERTVDTLDSATLQ